MAMGGGAATRETSRYRDLPCGLPVAHHLLLLHVLDCGCVAEQQ
jgi:hypothetical protein